MAGSGYRWWIRFSPENVLSAQIGGAWSITGQVAFIAAVLAVPFVERVVGVDATLSAPIILSYAVWAHVAQRLLVPRAKASPVAFHALNLGDVGLGIAIVVALPISSGDPASPLWMLALLFAGLNGADYDYDPSLLMLLLHGTSPLLGIPIYLATGVELGPAVGGPLFTSACCFLAYHYNAERRSRVRTMLSERDSLQRQLDEERAQRERERIARDLHDSVGASLSTAALYADVLANAPSDPDEVRRLAEALATAAREGLGELRGLLDALSPDDVDAKAFCDALRAHGERVAGAASLGIEVSLEGDDATPLPSALRFALARVFQEGLNNVARHAGATRALVRLSVGDGRARLALVDDGRGFEAPAEGAGRGVKGMRARVEELGGTFSIRSPGGAGTELVVELPLSAPAKAA